MKNDLCILNATLVTHKAVFRADVACRAGRIAEVAPNVSPSPGAQVIDAEGCYLFPGFIDPHVHAWLPLPATSAASDFATASRAALLGGTTTIMDFAGAGPEPSVSYAFSEWAARAALSSCDVRLHATVTHFDDAVRRDLLALAKDRRIAAVKIYLAYKPTLAISDADLLPLLAFCAEHSLVVMAHCENPDLIPYLQQRLLAADRTGPEWHEPSRPPWVEAEGVARFLAFAAATGATPYVVHVSSAAALAAADAARPHCPGLRLETMPHYLLLDASLTARPDFEGAKWILSPPLRDAANQAPLWDALADGRIDTLATDHCPFNFATQKTLGRGDFTRIPNGILGVEERPALVYSEGVRKNRLTLQRFVEVASVNPAKIFGLYPRKGSLEPGADADLVVWDPHASRTISAATQSIPTDYNPYEGFRVTGLPRDVVLRGRPLVQNRRFDGPERQGILL